MEKLHILNTTIMPADGVYRCSTVSVEEARKRLEGAELVSHVGHVATATIVTDLLGKPIPYSREPWDGSGTAIAFKLNGRPEEGRIYTRDEIERIGYSFKLVERLSEE